MKAKIWLTGFEPFGHHTENPSQQLVERLLNTTRTHHFVETTVHALGSASVEMTFSGMILSVNEAGSRHSVGYLTDVDAVVHVGLHENAEKIQLEMSASNENHFRIADNSGRHISKELIIESGDSRLHTTADRDTIESAFSSNDDAIISEDCGRFVCNETYYRTLHSINAHGFQSRGRALPAIFVHIPSFHHVSEEVQLEILCELCAHIVQTL
jgi:pyrrolidone-carboxylate peptidase